MAQHVQYRDPSDTNAAPSPAIWADFDEAPVGKWAHFFDDYFAFDATTATGQVITQETSGLIEETSPTSTITGHGILNVSSNGHNAAHDGINIQFGATGAQEIWCPVAKKPLLFEARVMVNDESDEFFIGLCDAETDIIEQTSGMLDATARNMIGFYTDAGTTASYVEFVSAQAGTSEQNTDLTGIAADSTETALEDNVWIKLGFMVYSKLGALRIKPFVNGKAYSEITDTDDIPITVGTGDMALSYVAQVAATGANAELYVDWVRIAQLR